MNRDKIDGFLLRILRPALVNTVGIVAFVAVGVFGVLQINWASSGPALERRGLLIGVLLLVAAGWGVWSWRRQRGVLARGLAGVAEVLEVKETGSEGGLVNLALLLRLTDVGAAIEPQWYQIFRVPRSQQRAEAFAPGTRRGVHIVPDDLSLVMLQRASGKSFACHRMDGSRNSGE